MYFPGGHVSVATLLHEVSRTNTWTEAHWWCELIPQKLMYLFGFIGAVHISVPQAQDYGQSMKQAPIFKIKLHSFDLKSTVFPLTGRDKYFCCRQEMRSTYSGWLAVLFLLLFILVRLLPLRYFKFHCTSFTSLWKFLVGLFFSRLSVFEAERKTNLSLVRMRLPSLSQTRLTCINRITDFISKGCKGYR